MGNLLDIAGLPERRFKLGADIIGSMFETISKQRSWGFLETFCSYDLRESIMMFELLDNAKKSTVIKVVGVGGAGGNAVSHTVSYTHLTLPTKRIV